MPEIRSIVLAISPELTSFPLQHLFLDPKVASTCPRESRNILISLVPSLGWASLRRGDSSFHQHKLNFSISCDGDEALRQAGPAVKDQLQCIDHLPINARVILGHGSQSERSGEPFPQVAIGNGRLNSLQSWSRVVRRRLVVIHSCRSGLNKTIFNRDFGGLPGLALGLGCDVLFAPVTDVSSYAAVVLNRHLFALEGPDQIGLRYLSAIREAPAVCLYNLYGIGNESLYVDGTRPLANVQSLVPQSDSELKTVA